MLANACISSFQYSLKALAHKPWPVVYRTVHASAVDVVKFLMICPVCLNIVDLKADIWRYPAASLATFEKTSVQHTNGAEWGLNHYPEPVGDRTT